MFVGFGYWIHIVPTFRIHHGSPSAIEPPLIFFADLFSDHSWKPSVISEGSDTHLIVVRGPAGDSPLAGVMGIVPVLHVVLLGHAAGAGVPYVLVAQDFFDLFRRIFVYKEPSPGFGVIGAPWMPHGYRARLSCKIGHVGEHCSNHAY